MVVVIDNDDNDDDNNKIGNPFWSKMGNMEEFERLMTKWVKTFTYVGKLKIQGKIFTDCNFDLTTHSTEN